MSSSQPCVRGYTPPSYFTFGSSLCMVVTGIIEVEVASRVAEDGIAKRSSREDGGAASVASRYYSPDAASEA